MKCIPGIGEAKRLEKMHITMMCINAEPDEQVEIKKGFRRTGDKFTDLTGKGGFLINFKGLDYRLNLEFTYRIHSGPAI